MITFRQEVDQIAFHVSVLIRHVQTIHINSFSSVESTNVKFARVNSTYKVTDQ